MSWWWEFFDQRGLTSYFDRVRVIRDRMLAAGGGDFKGLTASAPGATALAVRCGHTVFVYVRNPLAESQTTTVSVPVAVSSAERYDPEAGHFEPLSPSHSAVGNSEFAVALAPQRSQVLILRE
jgi:hypothetical protein